MWRAEGRAKDLTKLRIRFFGRWLLFDAVFL
jgi:hypothetical protein